MSTIKVSEYIKRLKRRQRFLADRIGDRDEESSHYDRAELIALQWIIRYVEDTIIDAADHQNKWFEENNNERRV